MSLTVWTGPDQQAEQQLCQLDSLFLILAQDILLVSRLNNIYQYKDRDDKVESGLAHGCYLMFKKI